MWYASGSTRTKTWRRRGVKGADLTCLHTGRVFDVKVDWVGFDEEETSREPLPIIWDCTPQFVKSKLRRLRLDRGVRLRSRKL